ncbi:MAG: hypothetical protein H8K09_16685 [Nitrospira sp.]|nr:hypothetical protein [Nitrospira sp.]
MTNRLLCLTAIWGPVVYFLQHRKNEETLRKAHGELEARVEERTHELALVNQTLLQEISERRETERSLRESETSLRASQAELQDSRARHAKATEVEVELICEEELISLSIRDNGVGFDLGHIAQSCPRLGLLSMKERVPLVDGRLDVVTAPGQGTHLEVQVPLQGAPHA